MTQQYEAPIDLGEEIKLLFNTFDTDRNGVVSFKEIQTMLQHIDPVTWTEETLRKLLGKIDDNGDGDIQFTEFWSWIAGHGSCGTNPLKDQLLTYAIAEDEIRFNKAQQWEAAHVEAEAEKARQLQRANEKAAEREAGQRIKKADFIEQQVEVGVNRHVAANMFAKGDEDNDGEIDRQERGWLATEQATTVGQIKGIFKTSYETVAGDSEDAAMEEIISAFSAWDVDGDGTVSREELIRVIRTLNPKLGEVTAANMIKQADTDGDGEIDIREFVGWISGMNPKKKKAKAVRQAKMAMALHKKRSSEAKELGLQPAFEDYLHNTYVSVAQDPKAYGMESKPKIHVTCGTLNRGPMAHRLCETCHNRHVWLCHGCGFISYYDDCVNGCSFGSSGWTCIAGDCRKKCGCKKKIDFWQRKGFLQDISNENSLICDVRRILGVCEDSPCPPCSSP